MSGITFFKEGFKNLKTIGTVTRSSKYVSKAMLDQIHFETSDVIVEIGAGDGAITKHIVNRLKKNARLFVFEINPEFCKSLKNIQDPRVIICESSAEEMKRILSNHNIHQVDAIVSAIPFVVLDEPLRNSILETCYSLLKSKGTFVQIHYSLILKNWYKEKFGNVLVNFIPFNLPPAFVLTGIKE